MDSDGLNLLHYMLFVLVDIFGVPDFPVILPGHFAVHITKSLI